MNSVGKLIVSDGNKYIPQEMGGHVKIDATAQTTIQPNVIENSMIKLIVAGTYDGIDIRKTNLDVDGTTIQWTDATNKNTLEVADIYFKNNDALLDNA